MKHLSLRRARTARSLFAVAALSLAVPAGASADIAITSFKAGPVPTYNHVSGLGLTSGAPFGNSFDSTCAYGVPGVPSATEGAIDATGPDAPLNLATQAGANSDYCVAFRLGREDAAVGQDLNTTLVELPVGTLAEIDNAAKCTVEEFARESTALTNCPTASQVGTATAKLQVATGALTRVTQDTPGRIFALSTPADKAALLGVALVGSSPAGTAETKFLITVSQQGSPTVGLLNQTDSLNRVLAQSANAPIAIWANALRFWGKASEHSHVGNRGGAPTTPAANFFRLGTTCQTPQVTKLTVNPYTGTNPVTGAPYTGTTNPTNSASTPYNLTGCEKLPFNPTFAASISGETEPGGHPALSIKITSPEGDQDLGATKITLPQGIATDLTRIQNACPQATFEADNCTDVTNIGTVKATLSGINPDVVTGIVHMVKVEGQTLPALGFDFNGRLPLRIAGVSTIDASSRIVNTFVNLPSIPQRSLSVDLVGGAKGILQLPNTTRCTASAYDAVLTSQNGVAKSFSIPKLCGEQFTARLQNADTRRPALFFGGAAPTGKRVQSIRLSFPPGLTVNRNRTRSGITVKNLSSGVEGETSRARLSSKTLRFTLPKGGSNGLTIITRTRTLGASARFADRETATTLDARVVYTDGSKATVKVPIVRQTS
ncbi:MAG: hypothetical protein JHD16_12870 [Solirubrobacteraceae bacterium]|nr:hypothetical protein [Solirubrobacteraceae bacterium]